MSYSALRPEPRNAYVSLRMLARVARRCWTAFLYLLVAVVCWMTMDWTGGGWIGVAWSFVALAAVFSVFALCAGVWDGIKRLTD
jgi:hypothetical protein